MLKQRSSWSARVSIWLGVLLVGASTARADVHGTWAEDPNTPNLFYFQYSVSNLPDFDQRRSGLPNNGNAYCVPTATMNMMAYAANHGFPTVMPGPGDWESQSLHAQATAALATIGQCMFTDPNNGTNKTLWFLSLVHHPPCGIGPLVPQDKFTVIAYFKSSSYLPRMYKAAQDAIFTNGLFALCHGWYLAGGPCNPNAPFVVRDNGHCLTVQEVSGYWQKGTGNYGADVCLRDPWSNENPTDLFAQSSFDSNCYSLHLQTITQSPTCFPQIKLDRLTFPGDQSLRLVDKYLIIHPKAAYSFLPDPVEPMIVWIAPFKFSQTDPTPVIQTWTMPAGTDADDVTIGPDPSTFIYIKPSAAGPAQVTFFDPLLGADPEPLDLTDVDLTDPHDLVVGRRRALYVLDGADLVCINIDSTPPQEVSRVVPPDPCDEVIYDDAVDEVVMLSQVGREVYRYPYHLDAVPVIFSVPGEIPMQGEITMAVSPVDGSLWMINSSFAALFHMTVDPDGTPSAQSFVNLPAVQVPPAAMDVDDQGHIFLSVDGAVVELMYDDETAEVSEVAGSAFAGLPAGTVLRMTKNRTNYDEAEHGGPEWLDTPPLDTAPEISDCFADIDPAGGDETVGSTDLLALLAEWGPCDPCQADLDGSGAVGTPDLLLLLAAWGPCPALDFPLFADSCETPSLVSEGVHAFDNTAATTDGADLPTVCDEGSGLVLGADIWIYYQPSASGTATISICNTADYDTRMAAYTGNCDALTLVGCNDDAIGCGLTSEMTIPVVFGELVRIRLGGWNGAQGSGTVSISVE